MDIRFISPSKCPASFLGPPTPYLVGAGVLPRQ